MRAFGHDDSRPLSYVFFLMHFFRDQGDEIAGPENAPRAYMEIAENIDEATLRELHAGRMHSITVVCSDLAEVLSHASQMPRQKLRPRGRRGHALGDHQASNLGGNGHSVPALSLPQVACVQ